MQGIKPRKLEPREEMQGIGNRQGKGSFNHPQLGIHEGNKGGGHKDGGLKDGKTTHTRSHEERTY